MKVIKEVIVVEGKHDSATLKQYFKCDTVITNGLSLDEETLAYIKELNETRGVILFLDPDSPGNRIRHRINEAVPGCKNAFVDKVNARTDKKVTTITKAGDGETSEEDSFLDDDQSLDDYFRT